MEKTKVFVVILFLVSVNGFSQKIKFSLSYDIISIGKVKYIKLLCIIPRDIENTQKVTQITYSIQPKRVFVKKGYSYAEFLILNPEVITQINIDVSMKLYQKDFSYVRKSKFRTKETILGFLKKEKYIDSNKKNIKEKAAELKSTDTLTTLQNIYYFVKQHIKYKYHSYSIGANKALKTKTGDCTEYSDLFVALCRANNIPARTVYGYVSKYGKLAKHTWVEVFINKYGWVRFEPTPGNSSNFYVMIQDYLQLSELRHDPILKDYNYIYWEYQSELGAKVILQDNFSLIKQKD